MNYNTSIEDLFDPTELSNNFCTFMGTPYGAKTHDFLYLQETYENWPYIVHTEAMYIARNTLLDVGLRGLVLTMCQLLFQCRERNIPWFGINYDGQFEEYEESRPEKTQGVFIDFYRNVCQTELVQRNCVAYLRLKCLCELKNLRHEETWNKLCEYSLFLLFYSIVSAVSGRDPLPVIHTIQRRQTKNCGADGIDVTLFPHFQTTIAELQEPIFTFDVIRRAIEISGDPLLNVTIAKSHFIFITKTDIINSIEYMENYGRLVKPHQMNIDFEKLMKIVKVYIVFLLESEMYFVDKLRLVKELYDEVPFYLSRQFFFGNSRYPSEYASIKNMTGLIDLIMSKCAQIPSKQDLSVVMRGLQFPSNFISATLNEDTFFYTFGKRNTSKKSRTKTSRRTKKSKTKKSRRAKKSRTKTSRRAKKSRTKTSRRAKKSKTKTRK